MQPALRGPSPARSSLRARGIAGPSPGRRRRYVLPRGLRYGLLLLLVLIAGRLGAEAMLPASLPPVEQIPLVADMRPGLYTVAQAPDGMIFAGGVGGISTFDGRRHGLFVMPNQQLVRMLRHDGDRRLYVGGYGQFGFLEADPTGQLKFTDLTPPTDTLHDAENLADIWEIALVPEGVIFRALFHAFLYDPASGDMRVWHHPGRFGALTRHDGRTLLQFRGVGLKYLDGDDFLLVEGGELLTEQVFSLLPLPDGGLLTVARDGLWQRFHEGQLSPWPAPASLPDSGAFGSVLTLADGTFALGGSDGRLHLLDPVRREHRWFQVAEAYLSDIQLALDGGLLIQTDGATVHVEWPSPWTAIGPQTGLSGTVARVLRRPDHWLVVGNAGVYRSRQLGPGERDFVRTGLTSFEAWDWWVDDTGDDLLADAYNIISVSPDGEPSIIIENVYLRHFFPSRHFPDRLHGGTELGLLLLERNGGRWQPRFVQSGFTGRVDSLVELDPWRLLIGVAGAGAVLAVYAEDHRSLAEWQVLPIPGQDAEPATWTPQVVALPDGRIVVSTPERIFQWDGHGLSPTVLGDLENFLDGRDVLSLAVAPEGDLWAYSYRRLLRQQADGTWREEDVSALNPGVINSISFTDEAPVIVGAQARVLLYEPGMGSTRGRSPGVALRSVISQAADGTRKRLPLDGRRIELPFDSVNLVFEYALPTLQRRDLSRYRARLAGYERDFSAWGDVTTIVYNVRQPGRFSLEVEATDWRGELSRIEPFRFTVLPPWYRTWWAWTLWILLSAMFMATLILSVSRWRLARLQAERERLARMVEQRTHELATANRKLRNMANVDGLTGVANRRRLDEYLAEAWQRCGDQGQGLALILIDADHFKRFNDEQGHQAGDEVLREIAGILSGCMRRAEDMIARYGGEEFVAVMPNADAQAAAGLAETMRQRIAESPLGVTASLGVAAARPPQGSVRDLVERADRALYQAKHGGRNRVGVDGAG